ncbi:hypothetical protein TNCV_4237471 [Trichonephila clavipes]|nr:hypothetical protein TNCV_4237471 [Trichonephila clavipes]
MAPELAPFSPNYHTNGGFDVHLSTTRRVFSGAELELSPSQPRVRYLDHQSTMAPGWAACHWLTTCYFPIRLPLSVTIHNCVMRVVDQTHRF